MTLQNVLTLISALQEAHIKNVITTHHKQLDYSETYAKINLGLFSQTVQIPHLCCLVGGWGCSSLDRKHQCQTVIAAGTKQHLKWFVLDFGGVVEAESAPQLHQSTTETTGDVVCNTDVLSPHPLLCWCLQAILAHPNSRGANFFFPVSYWTLPH